MATQTISSIQLDLHSYKVYDATTEKDATVTPQANVYTVAGVTDSTGALRQLSIAELVMVICLARAAEKEAAVIQLMKTMGDNTAILEALTDIEEKILAGTALSDITDRYAYEGNYYSATEFLAILLGGATPTLPTIPTEWVALWNQVDASHIVDVTGSWNINGTTYTTVWSYLYALGISTLSTADAYNFYSTCETAYAMADGTVLSDETIQGVTLYSGIHLDSGATKEDLVQAIDDRWKQDILNFIQTKSWAEAGGDSTTGAYVDNASSYIPSDTDTLITQIESKMDSLNSFSQQKMIELQSETNKRDQSYDLVTNVLKSLNTVQIGNANNI